MSHVIDSLETARNAAANHAWREAYDAYAVADPRELEPSDLERYAEAAWLTGHLDEAISLRERAYAGFSAAGERQDAARLALTLSWDQSARGAFAVSHGWFANAERLLEREPESIVHGLMALTRAVNAMWAEGDLPAAIEGFDRAAELGERFGDRNIQVLSLAGKGRALVKSGEIEAGLALLDEGSAAAVCGELKPFYTGLVYCITISSCQELGDYRRAAEWTEVANRWCDRLDVSGFPGACRIHRAEIMRLSGDWPGAEKQALEACEELHDFDRFITAGGYYEVGEIRRRRGDFAAAEEAYRTANELGRTPQPGLALLRLAEGKVDAAVAGIARALEELEDPLSRLRHLPAQVEVTVAAADLKSARAAATELEQIVDSYKIGGRRAAAFDATVHFTSGRIKLAEGDWDGAARCLRRARDEWKGVGAPYETAHARTLLGIALRRQGDEHAATDELEAAEAVFERLGAKLDQERAKELLGRLQTRRTFIFTDIVDSTRLLETLGDEKWRKLLARHDELLRDCIVESGGEIIKHTGDGYFAAFGSARAAIEAAVAIQRALDAEIVAPDVRIGGHTSGAFKTDGEFADYGGQGVHTAARIGAAAGAGEILISKESIDGVGTTFRLSEPRSETLKGFEQPVEVVSVEWR
ncbi:MAG TPA: adenylate/guanylate cyclase domain-containing protein [Gaiellaceae bacterium]|nr:adenylate/guanylate cyclase domain-containing protein [Gaiellaceae bacterium]